MRRYLKQHDVRVVHSYDASGIFGAAVARLCGVPLVMTSQLSYRDILDAKTQRLLRWSDRMAHSVLVNCEAMRRYMQDEEGIAPERIELCYNGVDTSQFYPAPVSRPPQLEGASSVIGTVCALRPEKGLTLLQEAFAKLYRKDRGLRLVFVGSGAEQSVLERRARDLGIADGNLFIPATPRVADWMRAMDIFVLPSLSEAFSNSLLEAMACGCAAAGSRVGGTPELLGENERGLLFERGNAADLAAKLEALLENPELRREFGCRAAQFARDRLSIQVAAETTAGIYEKLLRARGYGRLVGEVPDGKSGATAGVAGPG
jgi:glycosyltransferase involved in cell wall biosynthesis